MKVSYARDSFLLLQLLVLALTPKFNIAVRTIYIFSYRPINAYHNYRFLLFPRETDLIQCQLGPSDIVDQTKVPPCSDPPLSASKAPTCPHSACLLCRDLMRSDISPLPRPPPTSRHTRVAHF